MECGEQKEQTLNEKPLREAGKSPAAPHERAVAAVCGFLLRAGALVWLVELSVQAVKGRAEPALAKAARRGAGHGQAGPLGRQPPLNHGPGGNMLL